MSDEANELEPLLQREETNEYLKIGPKHRTKLSKRSTFNSSGEETPTTSYANNTNRSNNPSINNNNLSEEEEAVVEEDVKINLKYGIQQIIKILIPVTICLFFVITSVTVISTYQKTTSGTLLYTPFDEDSQSNGTKLWMSIANASIFIAFVVIMTIILVVLYKFKFYKFIHGWLAFSSLSLLFFFNYIYLSELLKEFNLVMDMFTVVFLLWNFGALGMAVIHWKGPLFLQQFYLIFVCVQIALRFIKYLPEWTTWVILAFLSIWAVLCPFGPLRILVETAHKRNDQLFPAMVYSSGLIYSIMANVNSTSTNNDESTSDDTEMSQLDTDTNGLNDNNQSEYQTANSSNIRPEEEEEEENGMKLGLGDFIFYSILVGKASILGDWNTVIACFVAIVMGLLFTTLLLAVYHKPLPALPISLIFGLIFYFLTNSIIRPFYDNLSYKQYFI